jgi:SAM-dependent methyltransferase
MEELSPEFWIDRWRKSLKGDTKHIGQGYAGVSFWDNMAHNYNNGFDNHELKKIEEVATLIEQKGYRTKGMEVLDIGCGTGKLAFSFALRGAHVTALDFSTVMLEKLTRNIPSKLTDKVKIVRADWNDIELEKYTWRKRFDLVAANMTPAIHNPDTFLKMMEASRGICYYKAWAERETSQIFAGIWNLLSEKPMQDRYNSLYYSFNLLHSLGYYPQIFYDKISRERILPVEQVIQTSLSFFTGIFDNREKNLDKIITEYVQNCSNDGQVIEQLRGITGSILWNT